MSARLQLDLIGDVDHLRVVWQVGETLLEDLPFPGDGEAARYDVLVSVQEIVTNVLRHGYLGATDQPVRVTFEVDESRFCVTVADRGPAFDPCAMPLRVGEDDGTPPRDPGGWGVYIVRTTMDEVCYAREGDWNVLRLVKFVRAPARVPAGDDREVGR